MEWLIRLAGLAVMFALPVTLLAAGKGHMHADPIAPIILGVTTILFVAVVGRVGARKLGQPSVLGELLMGVLLGNVGYFFGSDLITLLRLGPELFDIFELMLAGQGLEEAAQSCLDAPATLPAIEALQRPGGLERVQVAHAVDVFSRYGVIFLLFMVGLDTSIGDMRRVGPESMRVAVIGVVLPVMLGFAALHWLAPRLEFHTELFVAATLAATSVGITARVLQDLHSGETHEARVILGAAVMDDILGLLLLAIVSGVVVSGKVELNEIAATATLATAFLAGLVILGPHFLRLIVRVLCRLDIVEAKMFTSYLFVMVLAWMANLSGLSAIIGAFGAGLILQDAYFRDCQSGRGRVYSIKELIMPLEVILVPIFFVLMGIQVKLEMFADWNVVLMAAALLVVAVAGKLASGLGASRGTGRLLVGVGMVPRGEVGLVFAAIGKSLGVITDALFSAVVLMMILTTLAAPPLLKSILQRRQGVSR